MQTPTGSGMQGLLVPALFSMRRVETDAGG